MNRQSKDDLKVDPRDDDVLVSGYYYPGRSKHDEKWVDVTSPEKIWRGKKISAKNVASAVRHSYRAAVRAHNERPRKGVSV